MGELKEVVEVIKDVIPIKDAYKDTIQPLARQVGKTGETLGMMLNSLLLPVRRYVFDWCARQEQLEQDLKIKLAEIPKERIAEQASLHVVVPAIQAWSYSIDCEELRNLYSNLLANAMITDKQSSVHPRFVEIIKQLHPFEALLFEEMITNRSLPTIQLRLFTQEGKAFSVIATHLTCIIINGEETYPDAHHWENMQQLGLIEINYDRVLLSEEVYSEMKGFIQNLKATYEADGEKLDLQRGSLVITSFGHEFASICFRNPQ